MKSKVVIIGSGNIGMDLLYKVKKSPYLEVGLVIGRRKNSPGLLRAQSEGYDVSTEGIHALEKYPDAGVLVFDATTAKAHIEHAPILKEMGKIAIDLTPAGVGVRVAPAFNLEENLDKNNINLISCGGQAVTPIAWAVNQIVDVEYAEVVSASSSKSVGMGTRNNIDEYTQITARGLREVANAKTSKAIIILNPAEPPITMHNTIFTVVKELNEEIEQKVNDSINDIVRRIQSYVPGYRVSTPPQFDYDRNLVTTMVEVEGAGDYLPRYAGNLDIMTQAGIAVAERFAQKLQS